MERHRRQAEQRSRPVTSMSRQVARKYPALRAAASSQKNHCPRLLTIDFLWSPGAHAVHTAPS